MSEGESMPYANSNLLVSDARLAFLQQCNNNQPIHAERGEICYSCDSPMPPPDSCHHSHVRKLADHLLTIVHPGRGSPEPNQDA